MEKGNLNIAKWIFGLLLLKLRFWLFFNCFRSFVFRSLFMVFWIWSPPRDAFLLLILAIFELPFPFRIAYDCFTSYSLHLLKYLYCNLRRKRRYFRPYRILSLISLSIIPQKTRSMKTMLQISCWLLFLKSSFMFTSLPHQAATCPCYCYCCVIILFIWTSTTNSSYYLVILLISIDASCRRMIECRRQIGTHVTDVVITAILWRCVRFELWLGWSLDSAFSTRTSEHQRFAEVSSRLLLWQWM